MSFLHHRLIAVLFIGLAAQSCAQKQDHTATLAIQDAFVPFVTEFERVAGQQGQNLTISDLIVEFGDTPSMNETGVCIWSSDETPRVVINQRIWATLNDDDREEVIFHELGHCVLQRLHRSNRIGVAGGGTRPDSVMYPVRIDGVTYMNNIGPYQAELFSSRNEFGG
jgi:Zn-dependent protease with chaperone function